MNRRHRETDDRHREELYARRIEFIPEPPRSDETTSRGRVVFHTVWLYYRDNAVLFEEPGPRIELSFEEVMARAWDVTLPDGTTVTLPTMLLMGGIMSAFDVLANEYLAAAAGPQLVPLPPVIAPASSVEPPPTVEVASE